MTKQPKNDNPFEPPTNRITKAIWRAITVVFPEISKEAFDALGLKALGPRAPAGEGGVFEYVVKFKDAAEAIMDLVDDAVSATVIDRAIETAKKYNPDIDDSHRTELRLLRKELIINHLISACMAGQGQRYAVRDEIERLEKKLKGRQAAHARTAKNEPSKRVDDLVSHYTIRNSSLSSPCRVSIPFVR
jgi:hypothetical protein